MMRRVLLIILAIILLSGCGGGTSEAQFIYKVHKSNVTVIDKDVIFEYGGKTMTAKGQVEELKRIKEGYLKIVRYSDGRLVIVDQAD